MIEPWTEGLFPALQACLNRSPTSAAPVTLVSAECTAAQPVVSGADGPQGKAVDGRQTAAKAASQSSAVEKADSPQSHRTEEDPENPGRRESDAWRSPRTKPGSENTFTFRTELDGSLSLSITQCEGGVQGTETPASRSAAGSSDSDRTSRSTTEKTQTVTDAENKSAQSVSVNGFLRERSPSPSTMQETMGVGNSDDASVMMGMSSSSQWSGESGVATLTLNKACAEAPSLGVSVRPLAESTLTLPAAAPAFLTVTYLPLDQVGSMHLHKVELRKLGSLLSYSHSWPSHVRPAPF